MDKVEVVDQGHTRVMAGNAGDILIQSPYCGAGHSLSQLLLGGSSPFGLIIYRRLARKIDLIKENRYNQIASIQLLRVQDCINVDQ